MRALLRVLAAVFLAFALVLLVSDGTAMLAANGFVATPLAATIGSILPGTLEALEIGLQQNVHPLLWEPTLTLVLSWPGWAVIGALGLLLALLGRSRRTTTAIDIDRY